VAIQLRRPKATNPFIGTPLPPLGVEGWLNTSTPLTIEDLRGSVVLVDFWSTDCPRCVLELPELAAMHKRFQSHGFEVVGLTPESGDAAPRVKQFVADKEIDWPIGYGAGFAFDATSIEVTPTYVLYDRSGRGVWGGHSLDGIDDILVTHLAAPSALGD
jgi:thiol-disulfide isomerase/thioredoxin